MLSLISLIRSLLLRRCLIGTGLRVSIADVPPDPQLRGFGFADVGGRDKASFGIALTDPDL
jgi:hypothetical protein